MGLHLVTNNFHILWNKKLLYRFHQCPPLVPILSHMNPIHTLPFYYINIYLNIIHQSVITSSKRFTSLRLPTVRATRLNHLILTLIFLIISSCSNYDAPHCACSTCNRMYSSVTLFRTALSQLFPLLYCDRSSFTFM